MQVYKWHHTASWEFLVSSAPRKSPRGMVFFVATARRSMRADSGSFVQMRRQSPCQYVNYCLRSFPCLCATPLAVRLFARTSSLLLCVNFSQLRQNHCRAEGTARSKVRTGCSPLTWKYCSPSFPSGKVLSSIMEILFPPSCGFPPKSFPLKREPTISGDTFGTRA